MQHFPSPGEFDARPRGSLPYVFQLPVQGAEATLGETAPSAVELDLRGVVIRLEDLCGMRPGREICDRVGLIRHRIPKLGGNGHFSHSFERKGEVRDVKVAGWVMAIVAQDTRGVEVEIA